jgi:hypothetical protein
MNTLPNSKVRVSKLCARLMDIRCGLSCSPRKIGVLSCRLAFCQIRRYFAGQSWAISAVNENDWNAAVNKGFHNLFKYISGLNENHELISMAVPGATIDFLRPFGLCKND